MIRNKYLIAGCLALAVTAYSCGKDFLEKMMEARRSVEPDIVLMDIDMPVMNGIDAVSQGKERYPNAKFLMLTVFDEDEKMENLSKTVAYIKRGGQIFRIS